MLADGNESRWVGSVSRTNALPVFQIDANILGEISSPKISEVYQESCDVGCLGFGERPESGVQGRGHGHEVEMWNGGSKNDFTAV